MENIKQFYLSFGGKLVNVKFLRRKRQVRVVL